MTGKKSTSSAGGTKERTKPLKFTEDQRLQLCGFEVTSLQIMELQARLPWIAKAIRPKLSKRPLLKGAAKRSESLVSALNNVASVLAGPDEDVVVVQRQVFGAACKHGDTDLLAIFLDLLPVVSLMAKVANAKLQRDAEVEPQVRGMSAPHLVFEHVLNALAVPQGRDSIKLAKRARPNRGRVGKLADGDLGNPFSGIVKVCLEAAGSGVTDLDAFLKAWRTQLPGVLVVAGRVHRHTKEVKVRAKRVRV